MVHFVPKRTAAAAAQSSSSHLVPLPDGLIMIANDNHYRGNAARRAGTPNDTEMILLDLTATMPVTESEHTVMAHRGASGHRPEHTSPRTRRRSGTALNRRTRVSFSQLDQLFRSSVLLTTLAFLAASLSPELAGSPSSAA